MESTTLDSLYQTCKDSHDTVKRARYRLCFGSRLKGRSILFSTQTDILHFYEPQAFRLFIHRSSLSHLSQDTELHNIKSIALPCPDKRPSTFSTLKIKFIAMYRALQSFPGMKTIVLFSKDTFDEEDRRKFFQDFRGHYPILGPNYFLVNDGRMTRSFLIEKLRFGL